MDLYSSTLIIFQKPFGLYHLKNSQTITQEFSNIPTRSKRSLVELESDRGADFYKSIFRNFLESKKFQHFSRYTGKGPGIAERVIRTVRNSLKKPVIEKRIAV